MSKLHPMRMVVTREMPWKRLTEREIEVLRLCAEGKTEMQIAYILGLGRETVKTHKTKTRRKLGVANTAQAVAKAIRNGLIE